MQPLPDEFDILHYVRITDVRKKSAAAAFIIGIPDAKNTLNILTF